MGASPRQCAGRPLLLCSSQNHSYGSRGVLQPLGSIRPGIAKEVLLWGIQPPLKGQVLGRQHPAVLVPLHEQPRRYIAVPRPFAPEEGLSSSSIALKPKSHLAHST